MSDRVFFDTNIFLYAGSRASQDQEKQKIAAELFRSNDFVLSSQVLQEYIANVLRKPELGLTGENVRQLFDALREVEILSVSRELVQQAFELRERFNISHWDAAIIAAAEELSCHTLFTEDFEPWPAVRKRESGKSFLLTSGKGKFTNLTAWLHVALSGGRSSTSST